MKIVKLTAENVKRLRAVEVTADGTVQIVTGRNAQGKSSVLDAIWLALGGGAASREIAKPVRDGEESASVTLDLGDLIVTRTWDEKGTRLVVKAADGAVYKSPQALLDQLVGRLSFDPLAFTRLSARDQREALLDLVGLDFTEQDKVRQSLYDTRTDVGRQKHAYGDLPKLDKGAPMVEKSAAVIVDRIAEVQQQQRHHDAEMRKAEQAQSTVEYWQGKLTEAQRELAAAKKVQAEQADALKALPEYPQIEPLRDELAAVEDHNKTARENQRIAHAREAQQALEEEYTDLGRQIRALDDAKAKAIAAAEMPVPGLGFDDSGVTFGGVPFSQASSAEQIRVSMAMAMALNPTLRVVQIRDGSLLDDDSMREIYRLAEQHDAQVWIERVSDDSEGAIVIEDGSVVTRDAS